jgi:nitrate reductase gamma subunit
MLAAGLAVVLYAAWATFLAGVAWRVLRWAATPVPFRIPTTAGQQRSLGFLRHARLENPSGPLGAVGRVALEVLLFRSLFRNTGHRRQSGLRLSFPERKGLWAAGLAFHWSLLVVLVRHLRLVIEPVPALVKWLGAADGFFRVGLPGWYASDVVLVAALVWLLARRLREPLLRYLTLPADYAALGLLLAVAGSGIVLRYWVRPDLVAVKQFALGLLAFHPAAPTGWPAAVPGASFWLASHVVLASTLIAVFPFTKLVHAAGAWMSPTRALANSSRRVRHVNPWNAPVPLHAYPEWEREYRDKIQAAGLPLDESDGRSNAE